MRKGLRALWSVLLLNALLTGAAHAQRFFPLLPPNPRDRLQTASYLAQWEFPPVTSGELPQGSGSQTLAPGAGPLVTMDYFLRRYVSVGGWWNHVSGVINLRAPRIPVDQKLAGAVADFWDLHASYHFPQRRGSGWSVQAGFSTLHYDVKYIPGVAEIRGKEGFSQTFQSLNFWVNRTQRVGVRRINGRRHSIRLFGSLGYHPSADFGDSLDLMLGGTLPLSRRLNVTASVWFNDVRRTSTRVTVGVAGNF